jgi:hypothetical protein
MADEPHGDDRNITMQQIRDAADAAGITPMDVVANMDQAVNGPMNDRDSGFAAAQEPSS